MGGGRADRRTWGKGEADGRTGGKEEADGRTGGGWANGRTARRMEADGRTEGGWADGRTAQRMEADGRMRADEAQTGRTSGRAYGRTSRGFKRPRTSFPASLSSAQTTRLTFQCGNLNKQNEGLEY